MVHRARLDGQEFRVIRPARPVARATLRDRDTVFDLDVDAGAAVQLGLLWALAGRSPRSLVHLPLRANPLPAELAEDPAQPRLDLVLLHHTLQFPPSRWPQLRARLGAGSPQTARLRDADAPDDATVDRAARRHRENRDRFHQHIHAETLFITGSAALFRQTARRFLRLAADGPGYLTRYPNAQHYCEEFHRGDGVLAETARQIHIEYTDRWS